MSRQYFDCRLRSAIGRISRQRKWNHTSGKVDDASTAADSLCRLLHSVERAANIDSEDAVECVVVEFCDRLDRHDASVIHQHVDAAECLLGFIEKARHIRRL